ncbi:MAG: TraR/DksA family transcriptional regulator [Pseudobdellovibrionaceae bacterium]
MKERGLNKMKIESINSSDMNDITESDLLSLKDSLLAMKSEILNKTLEFKQEQSSANDVTDEAEAASQEGSKNISIHLFERDRQILFQIEKALGKIAEKTYGQCESCEAQIGARRLQARPFTSLCIHCMEEHEGIKTIQ